MITTHITYFGKPAVAVCDGNCNKAWGINNRPKIVLDPNNEDDFAYLADSELGIAPTDPGTYEGSDGKPFFPAKHNKWCVRECERSCMERALEDIDLPDFSKRVYNMPSLHQADML